jgi:hypothetical protein
MSTKNPAAAGFLGDVKLSDQAAFLPVRRRATNPINPRPASIIA